MRNHGPRLLVALVAMLFLAGPTAGDIGSCSQKADDLSATKFFGDKQAIDCQQCTDCKITSMACDVACAAATKPATSFPDGCYPVVHDGEVCLDALLAASCDDYRHYMADQGSTVPTECNFCPPMTADGAAQ